MKLASRVAIVTGSARGIGKAIADRLASEGAVVVVADIDAQGAGRATPAGGIGIGVDVSSEQDVRRMVEETLSRLGRLDILVNNAALIPWTPWEELDLAEWRRIMAVNLDGVFLTCRAAYEPMKDAGYGRIVNIASSVVLTGVPFFAHYVAAKGGVFALTRALASELGQYGITVNSVAPGLIETEGTRATPHADFYDIAQSRQAIQRRGKPDDIASAVSFLVSEEAGWVTGTMILVDGGLARH